MFTYEVPLVSFLAPKEKLADPEGPPDAVAIGAGVGGTIAVLAVIAVVAFVVIKRRGKSFATVKRMIDMNGAYGEWILFRRRMKLLFPVR